MEKPGLTVALIAATHALVQTEKRSRAVTANQHKNRLLNSYFKKQRNYKQEMSSSVTRLINAYLGFESSNLLRSDQWQHKQKVQHSSTRRKQCLQHFIELWQQRKPSYTMDQVKTLQLWGSFVATIQSIPCFQATIFLKGETTSTVVNWRKKAKTDIVKGLNLELLK